MHALLIFRIIKFLESQHSVSVGYADKKQYPVLKDGKRMKRWCKPGSSLTEYACIGALVLVVCIGALSQLGQTLSQSMNGMALTHSDAFTLKPVAASTGQATVPTMLQEQNEWVDVDKAHIQWQYILETVQATPEAIEVAGANGATSKLSGQLEQLAKTLLAQNAISQEEANLLQKMAQKGYQIADSQLALEDAFASNRPNVTIDGNTYTMAQVAELHGFANTENSMNDSQSNVQNLKTDLASPTLRPLLELYQQATLTKAMANPEVNKTVTELVKHIAGIDDAFSWSIASLSTDESGKIGNSRVGTLNSSVSTNFSNLTGDAIAGPASVNTSGKASSLCRESSMHNCN
jgi:Flp pilus assembly pilin Flp